MIAWIVANGGTIFTVLVVFAAVGLALRTLHRDRKKGKSCMGNCAGCDASCRRRKP